MRSKLVKESLGVPGVRDWIEIDGEKVEVIYDSGDKEIFYYYDEDHALDYHGSENEGVMIYVNREGTKEAKFRAYSPTGNPDDPDFSLEDLISVEGRSVRESKKESKNIQALRRELNQHLKRNGGKQDAKAKKLSKEIKEHPKYKGEPANESLNESPNYSVMANSEKMSDLTDLALAIKGVLNKVDDYDPEFIDQMTDAWFFVNKQIGKASPAKFKKEVVESVNESVNDWFIQELMATLEAVGPFSEEEVDFILKQEGVMNLVMDYAERGADPEHVAQYVLQYAEDNAITPLDYRKL